MKSQDWLLTLGTLSAGILLGRQMHRESQTTIAQPTEDSQPKLTRTDIIHLIEANGGPKGLDFSSYDLKNVDLSYLNLQQVCFSNFTNSQGKPKRVANLEGVNFRNADLSRANLAYTSLQAAQFWRANLTEANLSFAQAENCDFSQADLNGANLYGVSFNGANLWRANLKKANLWVARLADAMLTDVQIGDRLIQENEIEYIQFHERWYAERLPLHIKQHDISHRHQQAAEIYMNLKNAYSSNGRYREASWAYQKERRMRRATMVPWRAKLYYGETTSRKPGLLHWRWGWFYLKYFWLWLFDWLTALTSGYGEKPLRSLWLAIAVVLIFPLLYWFSGELILANGTKMQWIDYLIYSLGAFTTMDFARFATTGWVAESIASIEALLGISILALLMFALGNRISRS